MRNFADLYNLVTAVNNSLDTVSTSPGLAVFDAATRPDRVLVQVDGTVVEVLPGAPGYYRMAVGGMEVNKTTIPAALETLKRLIAGLEAPLLKPTPTARAYEQFGFWVDVQDGYLVSYVMFADGGWDEDPAAVEFACQHLLDKVNADFGTQFTMDEFQEGDACACTD